MRYAKSRRHPQFRRAVHVSAEVYDRIRAHRDLTGEPMSALVERVLAPVLDPKEPT